MILRRGEVGEPDIGPKGTDGLHCIIGKAGNRPAEVEITSTSEVGGLIEELWLEVNGKRSMYLSTRTKLVIMPRRFFGS